MGSSSSKATLANCIEALKDPNVPLDNEELWEDLFACGITRTQEVIEAITPDAVLQLREERWEGLQQIILKCAAKLCEFLEHQDSAETPLQNEMQVALGVLTRLWPILLAERSDIVNEFLWAKQPTHVLMPFLNPEDNEEYSSLSYSVASLVLQACLHLCFFPDFASDSFSLNYGDDFSPNPEHKYNLTEPSLCWAAGIAITDDMVDDSSDFASNRIEVMHALLSMLSGDIFLSPKEYSISGNQYLQLISSEELPFNPELFYSLLNVVMSYDPVGWSIPFGATLEGKTPAIQVETALQLLLLLLNHGEQYVGQPKYNMEGGVQPGFNIYRRHMGHLCTAQEFDVIFEGSLRLLQGQPTLQTTYMPGAISKLQCSTELLLLFYHVLTEAEDFGSHILRFPAKTTHLVVLLCYMIHHSLEDVTSLADMEGEGVSDAELAIGTIRVCLLILRALSEHRQFALALRLPYIPHPSIVLPIPSFTGNHCDLLLLTFHKILMNNNTEMEPLYRHMMVILCNVTPFINSISKVSSMKLLTLVEFFSGLKFVLKSAVRMDTLLCLLVVIDNLIMYQYQGNKTLVYALMQGLQVFHRLLSISPDILDFKALLETEKRNEDALAQELEQRLSALSNESEAGQRPSKSEDSSWEQVESGAGTPKSRTSRSPGKIQLRTESLAKKEETAKEFVQKLNDFMPLKHIAMLLQHLEPQAQNLVGEGEFVHEDDVILFLEDTSMIGVLPPPPEYSPILGLEERADADIWLRIFTLNVVLHGALGSVILEDDLLRERITLFSGDASQEELVQP